MRFLDLPELAPINAVLESILCDDGTRIIGRVEAYSCSAYTTNAT